MRLRQFCILAFVTAAPSAAPAQHIVPDPWEDFRASTPKQEGLAPASLPSSVTSKSTSTASRTSDTEATEAETVRRRLFTAPAIEPMFDMGLDFSGGRAAVLVGDSWGFVDAAGRFVVKPQYDDANPFSDGLAAVEKEGLLGYVDEKGRLKIKPRFDAAEAFSEGLAAVKIDGTWGYIDRKGTLVVKPRYLYASAFVEGLAAVEIAEDAFKYIDRKGQEVFAATFRWGEPFHEGLACVRDTVTGKYGYIDRSGAYVVPPTFTKARRFSEGLAIVSRSQQPPSKGSMYDAARDLLIFGGPVVPDAAREIREASAGRRYGAIDRTGRMVIPDQYDALDDFESGHTVFRDFGSGDGVLNAAGAIVVKPQSRMLSSISEGLIAFLDQDKVGYMDLAGNVIVPARFDWPLDRLTGMPLRGGVGLPKEEMISVSSNGRIGYLHLQDHAPTDHELRKAVTSTVVAVRDSRARADAARGDAKVKQSRGRWRMSPSGLPGYVRRVYRCTREEHLAAEQNGIDCQQLKCVGACLLAHGQPESCAAASDFSACAGQADACTEECSSLAAQRWRADNVSD